MSEMSMVERVAEAAASIEGDFYNGLWFVDGKGRDHWLDVARAAIAAMKDPTPGMVEAADKAMSQKIAQGPARLDTLRAGWEAAIDAALTHLRQEPTDTEPSQPA